MEGNPLRSSRIPRYPAYFRYVFERARVGGLDDELFAEGLEAAFGRGGHAGVFEGVEVFVVG